MKKPYTIAVIIAAFLIAALPAYAGSRSYANDQLDYWVDYANDEGYEVFYTNVDRLYEDDSVSYFFELDPGYYYFVAEGGEDTEDIDMYVYDEDGNEIVSDTLDDNYPICEIEVYESTEIEVEVVAYSFMGREDSDYFCFVAAMESEAGIHEYSSDNTDDIIDYWVDWADEQGYDVLYTDSGELGMDDSDTYEFELDSGYYIFYAESIDESDDIDMYVYDEDGDEIISDELSDNYPICEFELRRADNVEVEVTSYDIARGRSTEYAIIIAIDGEGSILSSNGDVDRERPLSDQTDREYVEELSGRYMDMVEDDRYEMIFDEIRVLEEDEPYTMRITLGRGDYTIYAEGGLRIADLDLRVYDSDGYVIAEDIMDDNMPICEFSTRDSETFEIEIDPYEMKPGWSEGYYMIVIVRD